MGRAVKASQFCNLINFQPEIIQVFFRLFNPDVMNIMLDGNPQLFLKQAAKIGFADHQMLRDFI